jgi:putative glutamine amidotransferase
VLGGGADVYPRRFAVEHQAAYRYDQAREEIEEWWAARAEALNLPTLGICRGAQLMNVLDGGSLHMDVSKAYEKAVYPTSTLKRAVFRKPIKIAGDSLLHRLTGVSFLHVNSIHSQAIDRLGEGLVVTAREPNGVVQAIEGVGRTFWLGVQFHPELLLYRARFRAIFKGFIEAARHRSQAPS